MSKYDKFETIQERIDRLQDYYNDTNNGINKCFIVQRIKELSKGNCKIIWRSEISFVYLPR